MTRKDSDFLGAQTDFWGLDILLTVPEGML